MSSSQVSAALLGDLKSSIEHNTGMLESLVRMVQELQTQGRKTDRKLISLEAEVVSLASGSFPVSQAVSQTVHEGTTDDRSQVSAELASFSDGGKVNNVICELQKVRGDLDCLRCDLDCLRSDVKQVQAVGQEVKDGKDDIREVKNLVEGIHRKTDGLTQDLEVVKDGMTKVKGEMNSFNGGNDLLKKEVQNLKKEVNSCRLESQKESRDLQNHVTDVAAGVTRLETRQEDVASRLRDFGSALDDGSSRLGDLFLGVEESKQAVHQLDSKLQRLIVITALANTSTKTAMTSVSSSVDRLKSQAKKDSKTQIQKLQTQFSVGSDFHDFMTRLSQDLVGQMLVEHRVTRSVVQKKIQKCDRYVFAVRDFSQWVGSGEQQYSGVFYIQDFPVKAKVIFTQDRKMALSLVYGDPCAVGLLDGVKVGVKVNTVVYHPSGCRQLERGERVGMIGGYKSLSHFDNSLVWYTFVKVSESISCDVMKSQGFVDPYDTVLIRFDIAIQ